MPVSFTTTLDESRTIHSIALRAALLLNQHNNVLGIEMDVTATHANGCPLRLDALLAADDLDFTHDIAGIQYHLDRRTGRLGDCFIPRFHT